MRRVMAALGVACALAGSAERGPAQFTTTTPNSDPLAGIMPGQVVGKPFSLSPVGTAVAKAVPPAGNPIGSPLTRPYNPARPLDAFKGTNIDPRSIIAPVSGIQTAEPSLLDRLYTKLATLTGFYRPTSPAPVNTYTPGITRRNRARAAQRAWRPD